MTMYIFVNLIHDFCWYISSSNNILRNLKSGSASVLYLAADIILMIFFLDCDNLSLVISILDALPRGITP